MFGIEENEWKENENGGKMEGGKTLNFLFLKVHFSFHFPSISPKTKQ